MHVYAVTIGRNVRTGFTTFEPMSDVQWATFEADAAAELLVTAEKTRSTDGYAWGEDEEFRLEIHRGEGTWDGVKEESSIITLLASQPLTHLSDLRRRISELARHYDQDAIALTIGESELL